MAFIIVLGTRAVGREGDETPNELRIVVARGSAVCGTELFPKTSAGARRFVMLVSVQYRLFVNRDRNCCRSNCASAPPARVLARATAPLTQALLNPAYSRRASAGVLYSKHLSGVSADAGR
jgi:hypothetical protein